MLAFYLYCPCHRHFVHFYPFFGLRFHLFYALTDIWEVAARHCPVPYTLSPESWTTADNKPFTTLLTSRSMDRTMEASFSRGIATESPLNSVSMSGWRALSGPVNHS
jgi:hypothetical protein